MADLSNLDLEHMIVELGGLDVVNASSAEMCRMLAELYRSRAAISAFAETVDAAVRANARRGQGGQQVPFHGDFCAATPSVLNRLEWWARYLKGEQP
jgi:hypothetical protein